ncbi:hypothetical protein EDC04DRAFT_1051576 [Pisolithus marmoratus]|nr:hypothetical protein EDC04DRAFT_1051576 [Pisolithus marmoratus]
MITVQGASHAFIDGGSPNERSDVLAHVVTPLHGPLSSQGVLQSVSTSRQAARIRVQQRYDTAIGSTSILGNHIYARTSRSAVPRLFSCDIFIHDIIPRTVLPQPGSSETCGLSAPSNHSNGETHPDVLIVLATSVRLIPKFCCLTPWARVVHARLLSQKPCLLHSLSLSAYPLPQINLTTPLL